MTYVIAIGLIAARYGIGRLYGYCVGFDAGWIHRHLGGHRRPWQHGQAWLGNGLSREDLDWIDTGDRP